MSELEPRESRDLPTENLLNILNGMYTEEVAMKLHEILMRRVGEE